MRIGAAASIDCAALQQLGITHLPLMGLVTKRAAGVHRLAANAQQRFKLAFDPNVDRLSGVRTAKLQFFHGTLPTCRR
jgi:hypothetical protein